MERQCPSHPFLSLLEGSRAGPACITHEHNQQRGEMPARPFVKGSEIISLSPQLPWLHLCPRINPPWFCD